MIETAARAERFEAANFAAPFYTWEVAGKPVNVAMSHAMIDQMEQEAVSSFRSLSSRGSEIGGVLFGSVVKGTPSVVTVTSYEPVSCEYSLGPLYRLSQADLAQVDRAIAHARTSGMIPVGFYRSHTRKGLSLDADDRKLLDMRFADPHCFTLLIRPFATKTSVAGIFIWENGSVQGETSYLEFPFRASQLTAPPRPAPPAMRAQIVPIASRREPVLLEPPMALVPPIELAPRAEVKPEPVEAFEPKSAAAPAPAPPVEAKPAEAAPAEAPDTITEKKTNRRYVYGAAAVLAGITLILGAYFGGMRRGTRINPTADSSGLALRVERTANELVLTWNRDSNAIQNASRAVLEISDGSQHENVEMDLAQLRNGSIIYSPATADVVFRMDITGKDQSKNVSESVRVLRTRPSPLADDSAQAHALPPPASPAAAPSETAVEETVTPAGPPRVTRPFNTESLAQRLRPATSTELPDAPTVARAETAPMSLPLGLNSEAPAVPAPPPPPPAAVQKPIVSGGQIQTAQLISKKDPEYPKIARDAGAKGAVRLIATVGSDGLVKSVKAVAGHPLLVRTATDAVMQWVYRPTYLNGVPVETQTDIVLNFVNDR